MVKQCLITFDEETEHYLLSLIGMTLPYTPDPDFVELAKIFAGELEEVGLIEQDCQEVRIAIQNYLKKFC